MRVLDLFSGIGGFSLGLERAGMTTVAFCEIEPNAQRVLRHHWPHVPIYEDVRLLSGLTGIDVVTGGFPCTDLSQSAKGSHDGLDGKHSGLVYEFGRIVEELHPSWVIIENVPQVKRYKDRIQEIFHGYKLSYNDTDSLEFGAYCRRKRTFIVGHSTAEGGREIYIKPTSGGTIGESGAGVDKAPMLLPWKGGASLERLASCIVTSEEINTCGVRESLAVPRGLADSALYLMLGNSLCPAIPEAIGREILYREVTQWT